MMTRTTLLGLVIAVLCASTAPRARAESPVQNHVPGSGFKLYDGEGGAINFRVYVYARYLNQKALDDTYTDSFGTEKQLDLRHDIQFNKATLYWYGWFLDPDLRYLTYVWSANTNQGLGAQVVVAGNLRYRFSNHLSHGVGINALPGVRSTSGNFPNWLGVDSSRAPGPPTCLSSSRPSSSWPSI